MSHTSVKNRPSRRVRSNHAEPTGTPPATDSWDFDRPAIPVRSHLYHIEPIGL